MIGRKRKTDDTSETNDSLQEKKLRPGQQAAGTQPSFGIEHESDDIHRGSRDSQNQDSKPEREKRKWNQDLEHDEDKVKRIKVSKEEEIIGQGIFQDVYGPPKRSGAEEQAAPNHRYNAYEHKDGEALDESGMSVQKARFRAGLANGISSASGMKERGGQVAPATALLRDFEFRVNPGVIKDLSIDYSVSFFLEENHIQALAHYEYASLTDSSPADFHILCVADQSVIEQNPEALVEDNDRQLHEAIETSLNGKPTFLGVSNYGHWAIIALLPSSKGDIRVIYMNSAYGSGAERYFGCKPVGLGLCKNIANQINTRPLKDGSPREQIFAEHIYLEPTQQIGNNCGAVASLNIAGIAAWYRVGQEDSLEEFLGRLRYNVVLSTSKKKAFEVLIKSHFYKIKTGSIHVALSRPIASSRVLKAEMNNDYDLKIQHQLLRDQEETERLLREKQQNLIEDYDIKLQETMLEYYEALKHGLPPVPKPNAQYLKKAGPSSYAAVANGANNYPNDSGITHQKLEEARKSLDYYERELIEQQALHQGNHHDIAMALNNVGAAYEELGEVRNGLGYYEQGLAMMQALYHSNHPDLAASFTNVGAAYSVLGEISNGLDYLERGLAMRQALYQGNHHSVADSLNRVGIAYGKLGDLNNELHYKERGLAMMQALYQGNHPDVANFLSNVGIAYGKLGKVSKGLNYLKQGLAMMQAVYQGNHPGVAMTLNNIGIAYNKLGDVNEGLNYLKLCLAMRQTLYQGDHPDVAMSLTAVGAAYDILGDIDNGLSYYELALKMRQALYKGDHPDVAQSLNNVGVAYQRLGEVKKDLDYLNLALNYYEPCLAMMQVLYQGNHPDVATLLNSVGVVYDTLGEVRKGIGYYERGLAMMQALYPNNHPDVANSLNNVGIAYQRLGEVENDLGYLKLALNYYEPCFAMRHALHQGNHPDVATLLHSIGVVYDALGEVRKSIDYYERGLAMMQVLYPNNHPDVVSFLNNVGAAYQKLGDEKCLDYYERGLVIAQALYQGNHPDIAESLNNVGVAYQILDNVVKGLYYQERALKMKQALYESDHPSVASTFNNVGIAYSKLGDIGKYDLYKRDASSKKGLINKRGLITENIINVKQKLQEKVLNEIQRLSSIGEWSKNLIVADYGVLGYINEDYLKKQLGDLNNAQNIRIALSLCFEAITIGIANSERQDHVCAIEFVRNYPELVSECVREHPEYLTLDSIAAFCLETEEYTLVVAPSATNTDQESEDEFKGEGTLCYAGESYYEYYNTALDRILSKRLAVVNPKAKRLDSWYLRGDLTSVGELAYKVSAEFSNNKIELVLAPINLHNEHWFGLLFKKLSNVVEIIYMDSEQGAILPNLRAELEKGLLVNRYKSRFLELRLERQRYNNCGPELIENFVYYLTGTRATQEGAIWVHSLLVENSLLDPKEYGLKLEENSKLIKFLSNAEPIGIMEILLLTEQGPGAKGWPVPRARLEEANGEVFGSFGGGFLHKVGIELFCKKLLYRQELKRFSSMMGEYGIELPGDLTSFDVLLDNSKFNKLVMNKIHPDKNPFGVDVGHEDTLFVRDLRGKLEVDLKLGELLEGGLVKASLFLHKSSLGFKSLDIGVDSARLAYDPSIQQAKKLALDCAQLYGLMVGANSYSLTISGAEAAYQLHLGEYQKALDITTSTLTAMALPVILVMANRPYIGFGYSLVVAATTAYNALENAYSFALEFELMTGQVLEGESNDTMSFENL